MYGKQLEMGLYRLNGMLLFVSRGLGLEGKGAPRARFLCSPQVMLLELRGSG
jgi:predicted MPP superfamily phosphohydrolase